MRESTLGRVRLLAGALAMVLLPCWFMVTAGIATWSDELRYVDGGAEPHLMTVDEETGELVRAERSQGARFAIAGLRVGAWFLLGASVLAPLGWLALSYDGRRGGPVDRGRVLDDALVDGATLTVRVARGADGPESPVGDIESVAAPAAPVPGVDVGPGDGGAGARLPVHRAEPTYDDDVDHLFGDDAERT